MHELATTTSLIRLVQDECKSRNLRTPKRIVAELGHLTSYSKECVLFYFDLLKTETPDLLETVLEINEIPGMILCRACGKKSSVAFSSMMMLCPVCDAFEVDVIQGNEFILKQIDFEAPYV